VGDRSGEFQVMRPVRQFRDMAAQRIGEPRNLAVSKPATEPITQPKAALSERWR
jgi:hypothetical protein